MNIWRAVNTIVMSVMAVAMMMLLAGCAGGQKTKEEGTKEVEALIASETIN